MNPKRTFLQKALGRYNVVKPETNLTAEQLKDNRYDRIKEGIAHNETRGVKTDPYLFSQHSGDDNQGDAIGRYQVTEGELKTYGKKYLGRDVDIANFRKNPVAQDEYIKAKIKTLALRGNTPEQIADIHRRGVANSSPAGSRVYQDPKYVKDFQTAYNRQ